MDYLNQLRNFLGGIGKTASNVVQNDVVHPVQTFGQNLTKQIPQQVQQFQRVAQPIEQSAIRTAQIPHIQLPRFQPILSGIGNSIVNTPINRVIGAIPGADSLENPAFDKYAPTIGQFTQGHYIQPAKDLFNPKLSLLERGGSGVQLGINTVAPLASTAYNVGGGAVAGTLKTIRQGGNLASNIKQSIANPSDIANTGLGIKNPFLAAGVDLITTRSPKALLEDPTGAKSLSNILTKVKPIVTSLKGYSPRSFNIHPADQEIMGNFVNEVQNLGGKSTKLDPQLLKDAQNIAEHYIGQSARTASNDKLAQAFDAMLSSAARAKGEDALQTPFPKMGFVNNGDISNLKNKTIGQLQQEEQNPDLTKYEQAFNSGDKQTLDQLASKYPNDTRFQIHNQLPNQSGTDNTYYHGSAREGLNTSAGNGHLGKGVYLTKNVGEARDYAAGWAGGTDPNEFLDVTPQRIKKVQLLNKNIYKTDLTSLDSDKIAQIKKDGYSGVQTPHETVVFNPNDVKVIGHPTDEEFAKTNPSNYPVASQKPSIKDQILNEAPQTARMSQKAIQEGLTTPKSGRDISVNPQVAQRFPGNSEPLPWETKGNTLDQGQPATEDGGLQPISKAKSLEQQLQSPTSLENVPAQTLDKSIPSIPSDVQKQIQAEGRTLANNNGKGGMGGFDTETKNAFQDWVNSRKASKVEGLVKSKEFQDLNNKGINGIFEFQSGNKVGRFGDVKQYFDNKYKELNDNGIDVNYKQDYLPQLWANKPEEVQQVFGRSLGTKPSFTLESLIKNYKEGIASGLTPRFNNISELAGWYEQRANKALADKNFFDYLGKNGFIQSSGKAPQGWTTLDPDRFPKVKVNVDGNQYSGVFKAPPELASSINNYLRDPQFGFLNSVANYVSRAKNVTLSFGIPGTAVNAHGVNILARHTLFGTGGNPVTRFLTGSHYLLNPKAAEGYLNKELTSAPAAVHNGLTLSGEEHSAILNEPETLAKSLGKNWNNVFEKPLFGKMIPALKLNSYNELVKNKMDGKDAAKLVNNVYGGINWEQMGRNRDMQNLFRSIILAPDWAESNVKLGGNLLKSFSPWAGATGSRYRAMTGTLVTSMVAANVANKLTSGHYMYQNDPGHTMEVEAGYTSDGQKRYIRPYGTAADFIRIPYDTALGLAKGDPSPAFRAIANRFSIPLGSAMHLLTNTDYKGNAIYGKDKYGGDIPAVQAAGGIGSEALGAVGFPSFAKNAVDYATGKQGGEQALTTGLELPVRYQSPGNSKTQKFVGDTLGLSGKQEYDVKKSLQGASPFSENQKALIKQGGAKTLDQILQTRTQTQQANKIKSIEKQVMDGSLNQDDGQKAINDIINSQSGKKQASSGSGVNQAFAAENTPGIFNNKLLMKNGKTLDLTPPTKGQGIDAFTNKNWNVTKAIDVWKNKDNLTPQQEQSAYKQLGVDPQDVRYAYLASHSTDVSTQYITSKSPDHTKLINNLLTGRVVGISGQQFASNAVVDSVYSQGLITKQEATALKKLKLDKNMDSTQKSPVSTGVKAKKLSFKQVKPPRIKIQDAFSKVYKAPTVKAPKTPVLKPLVYKPKPITLKDITKQVSL